MNFFSNEQENELETMAETEIKKIETHREKWSEREIELDIEHSNDQWRERGFDWNWARAWKKIRLFFLKQNIVECE